MACNSKCYRCYLNKNQGANYAHHKAWTSTVPDTTCSPEEYVITSVEREKARTDDTVSLAVPAVPVQTPPIKAPLSTLRKPAEGGDVSLWAKYPFLKCYLIDGPLRGERATAMFFRDDGRWKFCLHDRSRSRSAWSSGDSWEECMYALDQRIGDETVEWRRSWERER